MNGDTPVRERMVAFWAREADTMREYGEARLLAMCERNLAYWTARATTLDDEEDAMRRCTHCHGRGVYEDTDGRLVCLLCAHCIADPDPGVLEKLVSNATPEAQSDIGPRVAPDLDAVKTRAMAQIRQEATP